MPAPMHSAGRTHNPIKARILPVAPAVIEGRTRNTPASVIVSTTNVTRTPVSPSTISPCHSERCQSVRDVRLRDSSAALGGWGNSEDQRNEINRDSKPYQNYADERKEQERERMKPEEAYDFHEQTQHNQAARYLQKSPDSDRTEFH